jgi:hypothetical protein
MDDTMAAIYRTMEERGEDHDKETSKVSCFFLYFTNNCFKNIYLAINNNGYTYE